MSPLEIAGLVAITFAGAAIGWLLERRDQGPPR